jgi:uncharacterized protein with HEPN domain
VSHRLPSFYFLDIFIAGHLIGRYSEGFENPDDLLHSRLHWDAIIREFEVLGEATNTLLKMGVLPAEEYREIVAFRNKIVHEYFGIDEAIVFDAIRNALPLYLSKLKRFLTRNGMNLDDAIEAALVENEHDLEMTVFLKDLKHEI